MNATPRCVVFIPICASLPEVDAILVGPWTTRGRISWCKWISVTSGAAVSRRRGVEVVAVGVLVGFP
jgi:hypothetical protein